MKLLQVNFICSIHATCCYLGYERRLGNNASLIIGLKDTVQNPSMLTFKWIDNAAFVYSAWQSGNSSDML